VKEGEGRSRVSVEEVREGEKDFALGSRRGGRGRVGERVGKECGGRGTGEGNDETTCEDADSGSASDGES